MVRWFGWVVTVRQSTLGSVRPCTRVQPWTHLLPLSKHASKLNRHPAASVRSRSEAQAHSQTGGPDDADA